MFSTHNPDQFLGICVASISSLDYTRDERIRILHSHQNQSARVAVGIYYSAKWLCHMHGALSGEMLATLLRMESSADDIDIYLPVPVSLAECVNTSGDIYVQNFSTILRCPLLRFVQHSLDISAFGQDITMMQLLVQSLHAINLTVPHGARWPMYCLLDNIFSFTYYYRCWSSVLEISNLPASCFLTELTFNQWSYKMNVILLPVIQHHKMLCEMPFRKLFHYCPIACFDFPHNKIVIDRLNCCVHQLKLFFRVSDILTLCSPKTLHYDF